VTIPNLLPPLRLPKGRGGRDLQNALRLYKALSALRPRFRDDVPRPSDFGPHHANVDRLCRLYRPSAVRDVAGWVLDGVGRDTDPRAAARLAERLARVTFAAAAQAVLDNTSTHPVP
jgi:outer membrane protein TolC